MEVYVRNVLKIKKLKIVVGRGMKLMKKSLYEKLRQ